MEEKKLRNSNIVDSDGFALSSESAGIVSMGYKRNPALLLSEIQTHFLYNALNTIRCLCDTDPENAGKAVDHLAGYLRANMISLNSKNPISFEEEMEHIANYVFIEKLRYADRVKIVYNLEEKDFSVPVLSVQPLVENCIRHGIAKKKEGGTVTISTSLDDDKYYIDVKDDGVGFDINSPKLDGQQHVGLANVKARLDDQCGGTLTIESTPGVGTHYRITIPLHRRG